MTKYFSILLLALCLSLPMKAQGTFQFVHPWQGKRVAYFGDSITDPKNNGSKKKYWGFLSDWLGIAPFVYGVSGRTWSDIPRQAEKLKAEHGDDFDAILIFIGTNDFNGGEPVGEWFSECEDSVTASRGDKHPKQRYLRRRRVPSMDRSTLRGNINIALSRIRKLFPGKQVVLLTPIHRAYFEAGDRNIQPTEEYQNWTGEFLSHYVESVKEAGNIWAVPVIDLNSMSGLFPLDEDNARLYFHDATRDRLHPNDAGHARIAQTLVYQLAALPCSFE